MKRLIFTICVSILCSFALQGILLADEIYQDENGVWTNRSKSGSVEIGKQGASALGDGLQGAIEAGLMGMTKIIADPLQDPLKQMGKDAEKRVIQNEIDRAEKNQKAFEKSHISDLLEYERVDPATAGEVKSEWEFFDDPRD